MKKSCVLLNVSNGYTWDDEEIKTLAVFMSKRAAMQYMDKHPLTSDGLRRLFGYDCRLENARFILEDSILFEVE